MSIPTYRRPFSFALLFHALLLVFFLFHIDFMNESQTSASSQTIVQAKLVSPSALQPSTAQPIIAEKSLTELKKSDPVTQPLIKKPMTESQNLVKSVESTDKKLSTPVKQIKKAIPTTHEIPRLQKPNLQKKQSEIEKVIQQQLEKESQPSTSKTLQKKDIEQLLQQDLASELTKKPSSIQAKKITTLKQTASPLDNKVIDRYKSLIIDAISQRWIVPDSVNASLECRLQVRVAPGGDVIQVKLLKASGNSALDRSAQAAVYKASPLPVPTDATLFHQFREFNLVVKPQGIVADEYTSRE